MLYVYLSYYPKLLMRRLHQPLFFNKLLMYQCAGSPNCICSLKSNAFFARRTEICSASAGSSLGFSKIHLLLLLLCLKNIIPISKCIFKIIPAIQTRNEFVKPCFLVWLECCTFHDIVLCLLNPLCLKELLTLYEVCSKRHGISTTLWYR